MLAQGLEATLSYYDSRRIPVILMQDNPHQTGLVPVYRVRFGDESLDRRVNQSAVSVVQNHREQAAVNRVLATVARKHSMASVVNIDSTLCRAAMCPWVDGGQFLYSDDHHLTNAGSLRVYPVLARAMDSVLAGQGRLVAATTPEVSVANVPATLQ